MDFVSGPSPVDGKPFIIEQWMFITQSVVPYVLPNRYMVSNTGFVKSYPNERLLAVHHNGKYRQVMLYGVHQKTICARIDRLVMMSFAPIPDMNILQVNHRDTNPENDCIYNLEWCTAAQNTFYADANGSRSRNNALKFRDTYFIDKNTLELIAQDIQKREISQKKDCRKI